MATLGEITDLFCKLAFHLQTLTHTAQTHYQDEETEHSDSVDLSISSITQSLNLNDNAGVRVLDTALSLMCFTAPQVFDSMIEYFVKTIVSVLSSSISCKVLPFGKEEILRVGSCISQRDCVEFIEVVNDVVSKLDQHGVPSHLLLRSAARVAVSTSCCRYMVPSMHVLDVKSIDRRSTAISNLLSHLSGDLSLDNNKLPLRLLSWYLDPLTLKHDISNILQETMKRPFLTLSKEFYERMEWRSILLCLVLSPMMFIHTRALLHDWFMLTLPNGVSCFWTIPWMMAAIIFILSHAQTCNMCNAFSVSPSDAHAVMWLSTASDVIMPVIAEHHICWPALCKCYVFMRDVSSGGKSLCKVKLDLGSVLEFLIELVAVILDVISRPIWWGIPLELASELPFSNAYFPCKDHLLRILSGPLVSSSFQQLVQVTSESVSLVCKQFGPISKSSTLKFASVDRKSIWALVICFPDWFYFASGLLFSNNCYQNTFQLNCSVEAPNSIMEQPAVSAARFIAWILSPNSKPHQDLLFEGLTRISECWSRKQIDSDIHERGMVDYRKKLKQQECFDIKEDFSLGNKYGCQVIGLWLNEFHGVMKYGVEFTDKSSNCEAESYNFVLQNSMLFWRIPLGILIGCPSYVQEDGFELLLHYAATGRVLHLTSNDARMKHVDEFNKKEAVAGACLIFSLTDIVERISASSFENEKSGLDIICQVKLGASKYLIKCMKKLIEPNIFEDGKMLVDLHDRLERWRHQGQEMLELDKDLDDTIKGLSNELLLL